MKLYMDERRKHQLIGVVVLASLIAVFVPALVKKSNDGLDKKVNLAVRLPSKPSQPKVTTPKAKEMFETIQVAHVDLSDTILRDESNKSTRYVKAKPIDELQLQQKKLVASASEKVSHQPVPAHKEKPHTAKLALSNQQAVTKISAHSPAIIVEHSKKAVARHRSFYAVQIASFAVEQNAKSLVSSLRNKGFQADYAKLTNGKGSFYRVLVGEAKQKDEALQLQKVLAESVKMKGFIIKT